jgi:hypothetical protein
MGFNSIFHKIVPIKATKDFKHNSILINIDTLQGDRLSISLYVNGSERAKGTSRKVFDEDFVNRAKNEIQKHLVDLTHCDIRSLQSKMSELTDDILPQSVRDFLIKYRNDYNYLVIEDDCVGLNFPFPILFFPVSDSQNTISEYGFFLSEKYTIVRANSNISEDIEVKKIAILSSEDLKGSIEEERKISDILDNGTNVEIINVENQNHLEQLLTKNQPEVFHFCCHGNEKNQIVFMKNGAYESIDVDYFNLFRFLDSSIIILNICFSNYTNYITPCPRSIAEKVLDRNAGIVLSTEWPIDDRFAYAVGTNIYKSIIDGKSIIEILHMTKMQASSFCEKMTALTYTLRGNPNIFVKFVS